MVVVVVVIVVVVVAMVVVVAVVGRTPFYSSSYNLDLYLDEI